MQNPFAWRYTMSYPIYPCWVSWNLFLFFSGAPDFSENFLAIFFGKLQIYTAVNNMSQNILNFIRHFVIHTSYKYSPFENQNLGLYPHDFWCMKESILRFNFMLRLWKSELRKPRNHTSKKDPVTFLTLLFEGAVTFSFLSSSSAEWIGGFHQLHSCMSTLELPSGATAINLNSWLIFKNQWDAEFHDHFASLSLRKNKRQNFPKY